MSLSYTDTCISGLRSRIWLTKEIKVKFIALSGTAKLFDLTKRFPITQKTDAIDWISEAIQALEKVVLPFPD